MAAWWPLFSPPEDYAEESRYFRDLLIKIGLPASPSLLELGCGGGSLVFHLKQIFERVTLSDLSPQMLEISRSVNLECEHIAGDMRTLRLNRLFDVVLIHDAICYMTSLQDLDRAMQTAYAHCNPGGVVLLVPDWVRETFQATTEHGGKDGENRALRYLEWTYDPDDRDTIYISDLAYLLREEQGPAWIEHEQHICGLFTRSEWIRLLQAVGFQPETIRDPYERDIFVARKVKI